jgi:hypothetical protein
MPYFVWVEDPDGNVLAKRQGEDSEFHKLHDSAWKEAYIRLLAKALSGDARSSGTVTVKWGDRNDWKVPA